MKLLISASLVASALALPSSNSVKPRASVTDPLQLESALKGLTDEPSALNFFSNIVPAPAPTSIAQELAGIKQVVSPHPKDIFQSGAEILAAGFAGGDYVTIANAYLFQSSTKNFNLRQPLVPVYPKAGPLDAPYSLTEKQLREVIYIPPDFTYGRRPPVIFLPGSGAVAGQNFGPNYGKLFKAQDVADPVYLNLPGQNLADIQVAAEYTAYAINYISAISGGKKVNTISWSAGSLDSQWAFKYWPSTRANVANKIALSGDYHGTVLAKLLCPGFETPGCTPAVAQQNYNSTFIQTLRNNGGDSAYVPTTNVYSIFDEIVQPQADPNASGAINDARSVGVSNTELQSVCGVVLPGGEVYNDHEGVLINALAYDLAVDAIKNGGPGQLSRIDTEKACNSFAADGLSLPDILATYALIPIAAVNIIAFPEKTATEPPIKAYALKDVPA